MKYLVSIMCRRTVALICLSVFVQGHLTSSAVLAAEENEGRVNSLTNAKNAESATVSKPNGGELPIPECDFEAFDVSPDREAIPYPNTPRCIPGYIPSGRCCVPCPPGTYWSLGKCVPCSPGTYNSGKASLQCLPCEENTVAPEPGSKQCHPNLECDFEAFDVSPDRKAIPYPNTPRCLPGYISSGRCCVPCPPGTYWFRWKCVPCSPGTYNNGKASLQCLPCEENTVAPEPGSKQCHPCKEPWYTTNGINCISRPTNSPTCGAPTAKPRCPTAAPSAKPTCGAPTAKPRCPTAAPSAKPTCGAPTAKPRCPTAAPSAKPTCGVPTATPTCGVPSALPSAKPTVKPTPKCTEGYYFDGVNFVPCPRGTYWVDGKCIPCKPGTYGPNLASTHCYECDKSAVAPSAGSEECHSCPPLWHTVDGITCFPPAVPTRSPAEHPPTKPFGNPPNRPPFWWCKKYGCPEDPIEFEP